MYVKEKADSLGELMLIVNVHDIVYTTDDLSDRGIGKTKTIIAMAVLREMPIVVSNENQKVALKKMIGELGIEVYSVGEIYRGIRFPYGILVDEISLTEYEELKNVYDNDIAGFVRLD